jgi:hypothetical protein
MRPTLNHDSHDAACGRAPAVCAGRLALGFGRQTFLARFRLYTRDQERQGAAARRSGKAAASVRVRCWMHLGERSQV